MAASRLLASSKPWLSPSGRAQGTAAGCAVKQADWLYSGGTDFPLYAVAPHSCLQLLLVRVKGTLREWTKARPASGQCQGRATTTTESHLRAAHPIRYRPDPERTNVRTPSKFNVLCGPAKFRLEFITLPFTGTATKYQVFQFSH